VKLQLNSPVKFLKGVGPNAPRRCSASGSAPPGISCITFPIAISMPRLSRPLARAAIGQDVTCVGRVVSTGVLPTRRGLRVFRAVLKDDSGLLECAWPGRPFLERQIKKGHCCS